ncbi:MAG: class I SAM-dependent methyltransferase [Parasporobacterium sp.]|nr:class I SAM-dependent methyltransferase [Parasporobacterium sp.]
MTENVGNVKLNYSFYSGRDFYSDGPVEDEMLDIVKNNPVSEFNRIINERKSWPILYHLSHVRENIVSWLPIEKTHKVLEIGAGCGAMSGALADLTGSLVCVDLSKKRSLINAYRHQEKDNMEIMVGNFLDIEGSLDRDFDFITLIGVLEYSESYIQSAKPYEDMLTCMRNHLAPGGKVAIAIENRLGLKYWAGCREDHTGRYFDGLENYPEPRGLRTFSKKELAALIERVGGFKAEFYYPYPDYKFPMTIYSDAQLPKVGELTANMRNFDLERMVLFDESRVWDSLIENDLFPEFSNSFLVVAERED